METKTGGVVMDETECKVEEIKRGYIVKEEEKKTNPKIKYEYDFISDLPAHHGKLT